MATLPESNINITNGVVFEQSPTKTFYVDPITNQISGMCDGYTAIKQTIEIILNVERFKWQIYSPFFGMQWEGLIGEYPGFVASELQRRIIDAFSVDSRITGISDFSYSINGDILTASLTVNTVYGGVTENVEVNLT
nr:MAG TPA: Protein of unknown function (DUF2634) [Caudoviricetes sp.]